MGTKAKWKNSILAYYDGSTYETVGPLANVVYKDDFFGASTVIPAAGSAESGIDWVKKIVGTTTVAAVASAANGAIACTLDATSEKQDAVLYHGDQRSFLLTAGLIFEARVTCSVLPTGNAELVWGMVGNWVDGPDAATYSAFFTADGSGEIIAEADDNATDSSTTTGLTVLNTETKIYRIDFTDMTHIRWYIDGVEKLAATAIPYAATGANATLQPYFGAYKVSGTGVGTLAVDYVRIWSKRS